MADHDRPEADGEQDKVELGDLETQDEAKGGHWGDPHVSEKDSASRTAELEPTGIEFPNLTTHIPRS